MSNNANHGERLASLEQRYEHLVSRLDHVDECVDDVKERVAKNALLLDRTVQVWDRRWWMGLGIVIGVSVAAGSGTVSLKSLLEWMAKLR